MLLRGKVHKFGDNVNTDYIISGKYKFKTLDMKELSRHLMEDLDKEFYKKINPGDFIVAGFNFGCGSSREQAPLVILNAQIEAVIAKSFARIFYRNAINVGLSLVECDTDGLLEGDELEIDFEKSKVRNITKGVEISFNPLPPIMLKILESGGLEEYIRKEGGFKLSGNVG